MRRFAGCAAAIVFAAALAHCGGSPIGPGGGGGGGGGPVTVYLYAAGDIGECGFGAAETGALLDRLTNGLVLALGDIARWPSGTGRCFRRAQRQSAGHEDTVVDAD